jgi:hypothetical protein
MRDDPANFNADIQYNASIQEVVFYIYQRPPLDAVVNASGSNTSVFDYNIYTASLVRGTGALMGIIILPTEGLEVVGQEALQTLARKCPDINVQQRVKVLLNFAPHRGERHGPVRSGPVQDRSPKTRTGPDRTYAAPYPHDPGGGSLLPPPYMTKKASAEVCLCAGNSLNCLLGAILN